MSNATGSAGWFTTTDHRRIATLFLGWTAAVFLLGALFALVQKLRAVGGVPLDPQVHYQATTQHGLLMVFAFLVPAIPAVLGHFLLPLQLGARELALPRFSQLALRSYMAGVLFFVASTVRSGVASGWTLLTPQSLQGDGAFGLLAVGLFFIALSWFLMGINFLATVHTRRLPGMGFFNMPVLAWGLYLNAFVLTAAGSLFAFLILYLAAGRLFGGGPFGPGRDPLLWQNYFWFVTTPAAFFAVLPAVGVISEVVAGVSRKAIAGYRTLVGSMIALLAVGCVSWGVHLIGTGQAAPLSFVFSFLAMLAAVPAALIAFTWLATLHRGAVACAPPTTFVVVFLINTGIACVLGLFLNSLSTAAWLGTTRFATAQIHYLMLGGVTTALLAGLHYWWPLLVGRQVQPLLGRVSAMLYLVGLNLAFFPQVLMGLRGVPQTAAAVPPELATLQRVSGAGMVVLLLGLILIATNLLRSLTRGRAAEADPWGASTLEWRREPPATAPADPYRFD